MQHTFHGTAGWRSIFTLHSLSSGLPIFATDVTHRAVTSYAPGILPCFTHSIPSLWPNDIVLVVWFQASASVVIIFIEPKLHESDLVDTVDVLVSCYLFNLRTVNCSCSKSNWNSTKRVDQMFSGIAVEACLATSVHVGETFWPVIHWILFIIIGSESNAY